LYASFHTASAEIFNDSKTETQDHNNQENILENLDKISFLAICQNTGVLSIILS
jgi:hypothetical protein